MRGLGSWEARTAGGGSDSGRMTAPAAETGAVSVNRGEDRNRVHVRVSTRTAYADEQNQGRCSPDSDYVALEGNVPSGGAPRATPKAGVTTGAAALGRIILGRDPPNKQAVPKVASCSPPLYPPVDWSLPCDASSRFHPFFCP